MMEEWKEKLVMLLCIWLFIFKFDLEDDAEPEKSMETEDKMESIDLTE